MTRAAAQHSRTTAPLGALVGKVLARPKPTDYAVGNVANRLKSFSSRRPAEVHRSTPAHLDRGPSRAASGPFLSGRNIDDLRHLPVAPASVSSLVADDEHGMGGLTWVQKIGSGAKIPFAVVQSA